MSVRESTTVVLYFHTQQYCIFIYISYCILIYISSCILYTSHKLLYTCIHSKLPACFNQNFFILHLLLIVYIERELVEHEMSRTKLSVHCHSFSNLCVVYLCNTLTRTLNVLKPVNLHHFMMPTQVNMINTQCTVYLVEHSTVTEWDFFHPGGYLFSLLSDISF